MEIRTFGCIEAVRECVREEYFAQPHIAAINMWMPWRESCKTVATELAMHMHT